ncbi:MAG TPA: hypothetical protein VI977_00580 [archaeon]|nr:hypothetical protein [archaeon]
MKPKFVLLGLVLIFISFATQQAFGTQLNPQCSDITVNTGTIRVEAGKTAIESFTITNSAGERFFIDSADAFDSSQNFSVQTNGYDRTILSQGTGIINVKATGGNYNEGRLESAYIELRGHFLGGKTCTLQDFGAKAFNVIVEQPVSGTQTYEKETNYFQNYNSFCENINVLVPAEVSIGNSGSFDITIENYSDYRTTVRLSGNGLFVNPGLISVPRNSVITENIFVSTGLGQTELNYSVENPECSFAEKTGIIAQQKLSDFVSINAVVNDSGRQNEFTAVVSLQNKTGQAISGNIDFSLPNVWEVQGEQNIFLNGFETKELAFTITANSAITQNINGTVSFNSGNSSISVPITFQARNPFQAIAGTAFAILGGNIFLGGIILAVIVIVMALFLLSFYSRKQQNSLFSAGKKPGEKSLLQTQKN